MTPDMLASEAEAGTGRGGGELGGSGAAGGVAAEAAGEGAGREAGGVAAGSPRPPGLLLAWQPLQPGSSALAVAAVLFSSHLRTK